MNFQPQKLLGSAVKGAGAVACGITAFVALTLGSEGKGGNQMLALGTGLAASSAILGAQCVSDVVESFRAPKDQE